MNQIMKDNGIDEESIMRHLLCCCIESPKGVYLQDEDMSLGSSNIDGKEFSGCLLSKIIFANETAEHLRENCEGYCIGTTLDVLKIVISREVRLFLEGFQSDQDCSIPFGECLRNNEDLLSPKYKEMLQKIRFEIGQPNHLLFKRKRKRKITTPTQSS